MVDRLGGGGVDGVEGVESDEETGEGISKIGDEVDVGVEVDGTDAGEEERS